MPNPYPMQEITNKDEIRSLTEKGNAILLFSSDSCMSCRLLEVSMTKLSDVTDFLEKKDMKLGRVNPEELGDLASEHDVKGVPHYEAYKDGEMIGKNDKFSGNPWHLLEQLQEWYGE